MLTFSAAYGACTSHVWSSCSLFNSTSKRSRLVWVDVIRKRSDHETKTQRFEKYTTIHVQERTDNALFIPHAHSNMGAHFNTILRGTVVFQDFDDLEIRANKVRRVGNSMKMEVGKLEGWFDFLWTSMNCYNTYVGIFQMILKIWILINARLMPCILLSVSSLNKKYHFPPCLLFFFYYCRLVFPSDERDFAQRALQPPTQFRASVLPRVDQMRAKWTHLLVAIHSAKHGTSTVKISLFVTGKYGNSTILFQVSQLLRAMPSEFDFDVLLRMSNLSRVQDRRIAAKVICQNERLKREIAHSWTKKQFRCFYCYQLRVFTVYNGSLEKNWDIKLPSTIWDGQTSHKRLITTRLE